MDYLIENLRSLYTTSGWSYDTLASNINEGLPENQRFSKDQVRGYEKGLNPPKPNFKNVLARYFGLPPDEISERKLSIGEIQDRINKSVTDVDEALLTNQLEIIAQQRVMLSLILASTKKPGKAEISDTIRKTVEKMVEDEKVLVLKERRSKR